MCLTSLCLCQFFCFFFVFFCFVYLLVDKINNHTILRKEQLPFERKLFVN